MMDREVVDDLCAAIVNAVDSGFDEQIEFTRDLVRIPSQMRHEQQAQQLVTQALQQRGYEVDEWELNVTDLDSHPGYSPAELDYDNCVNVVGVHRPSVDTGRSLILNGHIDVVPVGPLEQWSADPYDPRIDGDWLYGRGSGDMKAGLVANIFALDALKRVGYDPASTVYLQSVVEEECTGNGTLACLVRGYKADAVLITEPLYEYLCRASTGLIWFRVSIMGVPAHPSTPEQGINAIECAFKVIEGLKGLESRWNQQRLNYPHYRDIEHSINLNVGKIRGGDWPSSVPAWCTIDCRINVFPGVDPKNAASEIEACVLDCAYDDPRLRKYPPKVEFPGHLSAGYGLDTGSDAEDVLTRAHWKSTRSELEAQAITGYVDATVYSIYGDNCPCLVYGPVAENIHSFDERVSLNSISRITKTIALFVAEWCGLQPI